MIHLAFCTEIFYYSFSLSRLNFFFITPGHTEVHSGTWIQFEPRCWCTFALSPSDVTLSLCCASVRQCVSVNKLQYEHIKKNLASKCHRVYLAAWVTFTASWILKSFLCAFIKIHDVLGGRRHSPASCIDLQPHPLLVNINEAGSRGQKVNSERWS